MSTVSDGLFQYGGMPVGSPYDTPIPNKNSDVWFVDGTNGANGNSGKSPKRAFSTIARAVAVAGKGDVIYVFPKEMAATDTDPGSYAETVIITQPHLSLIGVSHGRTQGGLPQMKIGAGSTAMVTVRAPGVLIANMGFNGASSTGGGILLDDDGGSTKSAFGTTILNSHFKNCKGHATDGRLGGGIAWAATGGAWQVLIKGNRFYKNVCDICLIGTSGSVPQDVVIEDNMLSGPGSAVDVNLYLGGSGIAGLHVNRCIFPEKPALSSGSVTRYFDFTGCIGTMTNCMVGSIHSQTGDAGTFAAAGSYGLIPATMFMSSNFGETTTIGQTAELFRT